MLFLLIDVISTLGIEYHPPPPQVTPFAVVSMGIGYYLTLIAGVVFVVSVVALVFIYRCLRGGSSKLQRQLEGAAESPVPQAP